MSVKSVTGLWRRSAAAVRALRASALSSPIALLLALTLSSMARADQYYPVSTTIPIPDDYSEMLAPSDQGLLLSTQIYQRKYPSAHQNMQFLAFRNPTSGDIFYVQTLDPSGQLVNWEVVHPQDPVTHQDDLDSYEVKLTVWTKTGIFPSDFYLTDTSMNASSRTAFYRTVARKYKAWAIHQPWAERKFSALDRMTTMGVAQNVSQPRIDELLDDRYLSLLQPSQTSACYITHWRMYWEHGIDGAVPDYRTNTYLSSNSQSTMANRKCTSFAYTNGLLWDARIKHTDNAATGSIEAHMNEVVTNNPAAEYDEDLMIKEDQNGTVATLRDKDGNPTYGKFVCQYLPQWHSTFHDAVHDMSLAGWKGIYFDMAAMEEPHLCYDEDHQHDLADPLIWQNGIRTVLADVKANTTPKMLIFTEGSAEIYMDLVDAYLNYWNTAMTDNNGTNPYKQVPLFREVYGEVARFVGWQVIPVNLDANGAQITKAPSLTANDLLKSMRKAADFGAMFNGQPFMVGTSTDDTVLTEIEKSSYDNLRNLLAKAPYKIVFERGGGAVNWTTIGDAPDATDEVDSETGTAAVQFGVTDRDSGDYNLLYLNETQKFHLTWDMKVTDNYYITAIVTAKDANGNPTPDWIYLLYDPSNRSWSDFTHFPFVKYGLGADTKLGTWRTFRRDLAADLYNATGKTIASVVGFKVNANGLVDNIALGDEPFEAAPSAASWTIHCASSTCPLQRTDVTDSDTNAGAVQFSGMASREDQDYFSYTFLSSLPVDITPPSQRFEIAWDFKSATSSPYYIVISVMGDDGLAYNLTYDPSARDYRASDIGVAKIGLGADTTDGSWRTFRRNLADDLFEGTGKSIVSVLSMRVYANGSISNVRLWGNGLRSSGY